MNQSVHIVSFNVPYPPDYGGVMDVFYKIVALKKQGVSVTLHCFTYGRPPSKVLEDLCSRVYYYHRNLNLFFLFRKEPFIVISRRDPDLLKNLCKDNDPIIFEGLHCTAYLNDDALRGRLIMVRTHNIEHLYYRQLAEVESNLFRRLFFLSEAKKLKSYESVLNNASLLLSISPGDDRYFREHYSRSIFVGPFHPFNECQSRTGYGDYVLIHGDFSTPENNASALFLLTNVIPWLSTRTIIAGKKPSDDVVSAARKVKSVSIVRNPSDKKMVELINNAHICLLHSFQPTGMKLKLITSLCSGRHVIASPAVTSDSGLAIICHIATDAREWIDAVNDLMQKPFTEGEKESRTPVIKALANNNANAVKIIEQLEKNDIQKRSATQL